MSAARSTTRSLSLTDRHVIDAWAHMPPERFCPYSLLSGTSIGSTNRTSSLVFLWYSTRPYAPAALPRTLWCLPRRNRVSTVHAYSRLVTSHREALPSSCTCRKSLRGIGRLCTTGSSRTRQNCIRTECLGCESSRKEQSPALAYAIEGTRA